MQDFFKRVMKSPMLIWKLSAGVVFAGIGLVLLMAPNVILGTIDKSSLATTRIFAGLILIYGSYRLVTFYVDLKSRSDNDE